MKNYIKPIVIENEELAEGIYAASGCYTVSCCIHQRPEFGRGDYRIQVDGLHEANHHSSEQILTIVFTLPVTYVGSSGILVSGNGSNILKIKYGYHNNEKENIGLGDVIVTADKGLAISGCSLGCNYHCDQH